jgi:sortase A
MAIIICLVDLEPGDSLILYDEDGSYEYEVTQRVLFEEKGKSMRERNFNARWMMPTSDERLTLISCWPFETNSHRVVVVAQPANVVGT